MDILDNIGKIEKIKLNDEEKLKFKDRLIRLRKINGWSQEELGYKLNVSRQTVSKWESNDTMPELEKLIKLSKIYNLSLDELLYGNDNTDEVKNDYNKTEVNKTENNENYYFPKELLDIEKKKKVKKRILILIISIIGIVLIGYCIRVIYNFIILKKINDKFNEYKDVNNCYFESNEVVSNDKGTLYMITTKVWYKDGVLKKEETRTENGNILKGYTLIDYNKKEKIVVQENTKEGFKKIYNKRENDIIYSLINNYYYKNKDELFNYMFFSTISINSNSYVIENYNGNYYKNVYNKENSLIEQNYRKNDKNEESRVTYNIKINEVKEEDLNINLEEYSILLEN